jgi:hypothetical protein
MDSTAQAIFEKAIDDRRTAAVSVANEYEMHSCVGRFAHRDGEGFTFETGSWPDFAEENGRQIATFEFATDGGAMHVESVVRGWRHNRNGTEVDCKPPAQISILQRRVHFRVSIPPDAPLALTVWKVPAHWFLRDKPKPSTQLRIQPVDVGLGGFCLKVLPGYVGPTSLALYDRLRVEMTFQDAQAILDTRIAHCSAPFPDGSVRIGIAFQNLEDSIEGRRAGNLLDRLIATLQRKAIQKTAAA